MKKKKSIFKKILLGVSACLVSLCALIPFISTNKINSVSADTVDVTYEFKSSDTYQISVYDVNGTASTTRVCLFSANAKYSSSSLMVSPLLYICNLSGVNVNYTLSSVYNYRTKSSSFTQLGANEFYTISYGTPYQVTILGVANDNALTSCYMFASTGFNCNVYKVILGLSTTNDWETSPRSDGLQFLNITYYDRNDNYLYYSFLVPENFYYNTRTYFLTNDFTGDEMFDQGYDNGYEAGLNDGIFNGYTNGYNAGLNEGYDNGYNVGISDSNQYSFYNLFGAVLDAPVRVFSGLFNFNLLGVNLLGLITGLITLCLVVLIIKLCVGGK